MTGVTTLPVAEIFGPTFQGEGPSTGQLAAFIRLGGCNLTCHRCDTPYTWDGRRFNLRHELTLMTVADIHAKLPPASLTVITGGEPLMYQERTPFRHLVTGLALDMGQRVEIETNGTIAPASWVAEAGVRFNVSPKLHGPMSRDPKRKRLVPEALEAFAALARRGRANWKFVVAAPSDIHLAAELAKRYQVPRRAVWVMPEGTTPQVVVQRGQALADVALTLGLNLTLRQHVLLWPSEERGR